MTQVQIIAGGSSKSAKLNAGQALTGRHLASGAIGDDGKAIPPDLVLLSVAADHLLLGLNVKGSVKVGDKIVTVEQLRKQQEAKGGGNQAKLPLAASITLSLGPVTVQVNGGAQATAGAATTPAAKEPTAAAPTAAKASAPAAPKNSQPAKAPVPITPSITSGASFAFAETEQYVKPNQGFRAASAIIFSGLLALILYQASQYTPSPEAADEFVKMIAPELAEELPTPVVEEAPAEAPVETKKEEKPADTGPRTKDEIKAKVQNTGILKALKSGNSAIAQVFKGSFGSLDAALQDVGGIVVSDNMVVREGRGSNTGGSGQDIKVDAGAEGRSMGLGDKAKKVVEAKIDVANLAQNSTLDQNSILDVIKKNKRGIQACYEQELQKNPELQGKVVLKLTVGEDGKVSEYEIESSTLDNEEVHKCMLTRVRRWQFPKPEGGPASFSLPFVFTQAG